MRCRIQFALAGGSRNSPKLRSEQHRHSPRAAAEWDCNQGTGESAGTAPAVNFTSNHEAAGQACCFPITKASTQRVRRKSGHRHVYLGNCSLSRNFSGSLSRSDLSKSSVALTIREDPGPGCRQGCGWPRITAAAPVMYRTRISVAGLSRACGCRRLRSGCRYQRFI